MIRAVAVLSLLVLLVLVLYVPSAHPPERFLAQLRAEHEAATAYWGAEPATRMLDRAMRMQDSTAEVTPIPAAKDAPSPAGVNGAVSREMSSVNQRLFNNAYFRAGRRAAAARQLSTLHLARMAALAVGIRLGCPRRRRIRAAHQGQGVPAARSRDVRAVRKPGDHDPLRDGHRLRAAGDAASSAAALRATGGRGTDRAGAGMFSPTWMRH